MGCEAGVIDFADFGVGIEVASYGDAVGVVLQHSYRKSLSPRETRKQSHGRETGSGGALNEIDFRLLPGG